MNSPSIDIKAMIQADASVNTDNFFISIGSEPATPNNVITIYDTGGLPPVLNYNKDEKYEFPAVQIRVRSVDYTTGWQLIERIKNSLHGRAGEVHDDACYTLINTAFGPFQLDVDNNQRMRFVINFNLQRKEI